MIHILIKRSDAFAIDDQDPKLLAVIVCFYRLRPNPETFSAGIYRWTDTKSLIPLVENYPVEQEGLARSIFSCHCDHPNLLFNSSKKFFGLIADEVLLLLSIIIYQIQSLFCSYSRLSPRVNHCFCLVSTRCISITITWMRRSLHHIVIITSVKRHLKRQRSISLAQRSRCRLLAALAAGWLLQFHCGLLLTSVKLRLHAQCICYDFMNNPVNILIFIIFKVLYCKFTNIQELQ